MAQHGKRHQLINKASNKAWDSSNTKASRFSTLISVTKAPLNKLTDEVMNTTMDKDSLGTLLMDDPGGDNTMDNKAHIAGLWLTGMNGALRPYVHDCGG